jgi:hypothetical protein
MDVALVKYRVAAVQVRERKRERRHETLWVV